MVEEFIKNYLSLSDKNFIYSHEFSLDGYEFWNYILMFIL